VGACAYLIAIVLMAIVCNRRRWKRIEGHHQVIFCYNHYRYNYYHYICTDASNLNGVSMGWAILEIVWNFIFMWINLAWDLNNESSETPPFWDLNMEVYVNLSSAHLNGLFSQGPSPMDLGGG
jgi:hypothetical protein